MRPQERIPLLAFASPTSGPGLQCSFFCYCAKSVSTLDSERHECVMTKRQLTDLTPRGERDRWCGEAPLSYSSDALGRPRNSGEEGKEAYEAVALALAVVSGSEGVQYVNNLWDANFHRLTNASFRGHPRLRTNAARCPRMHCPAASLAISIQAVRLSASIISAAG